MADVYVLAVEGRECTMWRDEGGAVLVGRLI
jgi:hypothetical protein